MNLEPQRKAEKRVAGYITNMARQQFESKMKNDTTFTKNPNTLLNWFYSKTPYWDDHYNSYPIGKIFDRSIVDKLEYK